MRSYTYEAAILDIECILQEIAALAARANVIGGKVLRGEYRKDISIEELRWEVPSGVWIKESQVPDKPKAAAGTAAKGKK